MISNEQMPSLSACCFHCKHPIKKDEIVYRIAKCKSYSDGKYIMLATGSLGVLGAIKAITFHTQCFEEIAGDTYAME